MRPNRKVTSLRFIGINRFIGLAGAVLAYKSGRLTERGGSLADCCWQGAPSQPARLAPYSGAPLPLLQLSDRNAHLFRPKVAARAVECAQLA